MAKYKVDGDILAQGINIAVRIDPDDESGSNPQVVGFVQDVNIRKTIAVQRAEVVGELLPVSLDPTSIQTTTTIRGFIPTKSMLDEGIESVRGGGVFNMKSFNPNDTRVVDTKVAKKIPYVDFYDKKHKAILGSTSWAIVTNYGDSSSGKGYVMGDVTMESIGYENGPSYPSET
jgi:hypothetical protein